MKSKNYEGPHYVIFSNPSVGLLPRSLGPKYCPNSLVWANKYGWINSVTDRDCQMSVLCRAESVIYTSPIHWREHHFDWHNNITGRVWPRQGTQLFQVPVTLNLFWLFSGLNESLKAMSSGSVSGRFRWRSRFRTCSCRFRKVTSAVTRTTVWKLNTEWLVWIMNLWPQDMAEKERQVPHASLKIFHRTTQS